MTEDVARMAKSPPTIAIMQPYFIPYAGYFRLFAAADLFVIYDCVQFARRGWVHRNRLPDASGKDNWLTLPIEKQNQDVLIRDLHFRPDAREAFAKRLRSFPILTTRSTPPVEPVLEHLFNIDGLPVDYIERLLEQVAGYLGLRYSVIRSTSLKVPSSFRGQARIIEIARRLGAPRYVNPPGGRALYDPGEFADAGIELYFLPGHLGSTSSIVARILHEERDAIVGEILASAKPLRWDQS